MHTNSGMHLPTVNSKYQKQKWAIKIKWMEKKIKILILKMVNI